MKNIHKKIKFFDPQITVKNKLLLETEHCNVCDVHSTLIGEKYSKAWSKIL